jgi:hypothetical protein
MRLVLRSHRRKEAKYAQPFAADAHRVGIFIEPFLHGLDPQRQPCNGSFYINRQKS